MEGNRPQYRVVVGGEVLASIVNRSLSLRAHQRGEPARGAVNAVDSGWDLVLPPVRVPVMMGVGHSEGVQHFVGQVLEKGILCRVDLITFDEGRVTNWHIVEVPHDHAGNMVTSGKGPLIEKVLIELPDHICLRIRVSRSVNRDDPEVGLLGAAEGDRSQAP